AYEALRGADACLVLTEWEDFAALDLARMKKLLRYPIVIDGRNLFNPRRMATAGLSYYSVGRPDVVGVACGSSFEGSPARASCATDFEPESATRAEITQDGVARAAES